MQNPLTRAKPPTRSHNFVPLGNQEDCSGIPNLWGPFEVSKAQFKKTKFVMASDPPPPNPGVKRTKN